MKTENQNELTALVRRNPQMSDTTPTKQILLTRRSPAYWRLTFNHPPLNIFGPETIPQLNEIITTLETDEHVKVVVFDSAVPGFFLTHYDFLAKLGDTTGREIQNPACMKDTHEVCFGPCAKSSRETKKFQSRAT